MFQTNWVNTCQMREKENGLSAHLRVLFQLQGHSSSTGVSVGEIPFPFGGKGGFYLEKDYAQGPLEAQALTSHTLFINYEPAPHHPVFW